MINRISWLRHSRQAVRLNKSLPISRLIAGAMLAAGIGGCATVHPQAGFSHVGALVQSRLGETVIWNDGSKAAGQIAQRTRALLKQPLTVDAAVEIALINNQSLQADYEQLGVSEADLVSAGLLSNPVLSFQMRFPARPYHAVNASIDQTFLDLLLLPARKHMAQANFRSAQATVTNDVLTLASKVRRQYYRYQADLELAAMQQHIVEVNAAGADAARHLRQAGNTSELAYDLPLDFYETSKLKAAAAHAAALESHEKLGSLMGLWGQSLNYRIPATLPPMPSRDLTQANIESLAVKNSLALAAQKQKMLALKQQLNMAHVGWLFPGASFGLAYVRDPDVKSTLGPEFSIPLPIFNQGQPAVARAAAEYMAAAHRYKATAVNLRATVREDWIRLAAARQQANFYNNVLLPLRHRIVTEQRSAFYGMYVSVFAWLAARQAEIRAKEHYVQSLRQYWVARQRLREDLGGRFPAIGPVAPRRQTSARMKVK
ncbi:MAG: TolC family protein [Phycisphaerales bacterium]|nr:TolC family protein [Phycisphaerales bacterium]